MRNRNIFRIVFLCLIIITGLVSAQVNDKVQITKTRKSRSLKPEIFKNTDIGNPAIAGSLTISPGGFDITAGGADIWGIKDEFHFAYIEKSGDFDIAARIESLTAPHLYTKAGLMARENLTPGSRHVYFQIFPNNNPRNKNNGGFEYQYRQVADGDMKAIYPARAEGNPDFPVTFPDTWLRLKRVGNNFTGYTSTDGRSWKEYTTFTIELPGKVYLGPAVTSHRTSEIATAEFRDLCEIVR